MNSRLVIVCFLLVGFFNMANAQDDNSTVGGRYQKRHTENRETESLIENPKGFVALSSGFANPTGNFGLGFGNGYGNYALNGSVQSLSAGIPINGSNFGIALMIAGYDNPFDMDSYITNNVVATEPNSWVSEDIVGDYTSTAYMAGIFYTYPVKRFSFDARVMGGYISANLPEIAYDFVQPQPNGTSAVDTWDISPSHASAFCYDIGAGVRYTFRKYMCFTLNADFLQADMPFNTVVSHIDPNSNLSYSSMTGNVPMTLFNISLGVGFQFGR